MTFVYVFSNTAVLKASGYWPKQTAHILDEALYKHAVQEANRTIPLKECSLAHELDAVSIYYQIICIQIDTNTLSI